MVVEAAYQGSEADGIELMRPLRELGPEIDTFAMMPASALTRLHQDPEDPSPGIGDGALIAELPAEALDALVDVAGPDVRLVAPVRGAAPHRRSARPRRLRAAAPLASLAGEYVMFAVGMPMTPEMGEAVEADVSRVKEALQPWDIKVNEVGGEQVGLE